MNRRKKFEKEKTMTEYTNKKHNIFNLNFCVIIGILVYLLILFFLYMPIYKVFDCNLLMNNVIYKFSSKR